MWKGAKVPLRDPSKWKNKQGYLSILIATISMYIFISKIILV